MLIYTPDQDISYSKYWCRLDALDRRYNHYSQLATSQQYTMYIYCRVWHITVKSFSLYPDCLNITDELEQQSNSHIDLIWLEQSIPSTHLWRSRTSLIQKILQPATWQIPEERSQSTTANSSLILLTSVPLLEPWTKKFWKNHCNKSKQHQMMYIFTYYSLQFCVWNLNKIFHRQTFISLLSIIYCSSYTSFV